MNRYDAVLFLIFGTGVGFTLLWAVVTYLILWTGVFSLLF